MPKKKAVIFGSCQMEIISKLLADTPNFTELYEITPVKAIHLLTEADAPGFMKAIRETDLFIFQAVSDPRWGIFRTNLILRELNKDALPIGVTMAYFMGYTPQTVYLKSAPKSKSVLGAFCDYHDLFIMRAFKDGISVNEFASVYGNGLLPSEIIRQNHIESLAILRGREVNLDVTVAEFIDNNWRKERLFYSMNHCALAVLNEMAGQICGLLGVPFNKQLAPEFLDGIHLPIYPEVRRTMGLEFQDSPILINGQVYGIEEYVGSYFEYYKRNRELLELNLKIYGESGSHAQAIIANTPLKKIGLIKRLTYKAKKVLR